MTSNQAILLLQIYRGTDREENHPRTYFKDLAHLDACGLVCAELPLGLRTTAKGDLWVKQHMLKDPT